MKTLIQNGRLIDASIDAVADLLIVDGVIDSIGRSIRGSADRVIDATGRLVMPGFIDPHVHIHLPFMGTHAKDDYTSASTAAVVGGTTTIIEMVCPAQQDDHWRAYQTWQSKADGKSLCDYSFHMGITRFDDQTEQTIRRVQRDGVTSLKVFLAYKGAFAISDQDLYRVCQIAKELGMTVTAHCENAELVASKQTELVAAGKLDPSYHEPSRPPSVEAAGVHHFCTFLKSTGAAGYIVHTSCRDAVEAALPFIRDGVDVMLETVIPYLVLDQSATEKPDFEGAKYVMSPPLRDRDHQDYLWQCLGNNTIATVATDHAPFDFEDQKRMGMPPQSDFTKIPNGIPSIEHRPALLYTHGVTTGKITLQQFVCLCSTNAAKRFDMFPSKGSLSPGSDADVVLWDPEHRQTISAETHHMNVDYSGFEGFETIGRAETVLVRGQTVIDRGEVVGSIGHGRQVHREVVGFGISTDERQKS